VRAAERAQYFPNHASSDWTSKKKKAQNRKEKKRKEANRDEKSKTLRGSGKEITWEKMQKTRKAIRKERKSGDTGL
jgi:hypothetical protein